MKWILIGVACVFSLTATHAQTVGSLTQLPTSSPPAKVGSTKYAKVKVVAANNLGMHCMDREFSVFSILPPFNVVHAQVVQPVTGTKPLLLDDTKVDVFYAPVADANGSINSTSIGKTDFWAHVNALFGANLPAGEGLTGLWMPNDAPIPGAQKMQWDATNKEWVAFGLPITPTDDAGGTNTYPLMRIMARDKLTHAILGRLDVVTPVAQETDCSNCHATGKIAANDPNINWSTNSNLELQTKLNVLTLHDAKKGTNLTAAQPVLCASCHYSPALDLAGSGPTGNQVGHVWFSTAMHDFHGKQVDANGNPIFPHNGTALQTCYQCHPGAVTKCLRGAMVTGGMECLNCHGDMLAVGGEYPLLPGGSLDGTNDGHPRRPWIDVPRCQSCHTGDALSHLSGPNMVSAPDGIRLKQAYFTGDNSASPFLATNKRFAENPNTLFRFSKGHGNVNCESCHGSTHAEWPIADPKSNDNVAAFELQGHTGALVECNACHQRKTINAHTLLGPHGMHVVNDKRFFYDDTGHEDLYENNHAACTVCHGTDLNGTVLSRAAADRTFVTSKGIKHAAKGQMISCTLCHSKP